MIKSSTVLFCVTCGRVFPRKSASLNMVIHLEVDFERVYYSKQTIWIRTKVDSLGIIYRGEFLSTYTIFFFNNKEQK